MHNFGKLDSWETMVDRIENLEVGIYMESSYEGEGLQCSIESF